MTFRKVFNDKYEQNSWLRLKQVSIACYDDLAKLSSSVKVVHFRKFLSLRLLEEVIKRCPNLKLVSFSRYAFKRCDEKVKEMLVLSGIQVLVNDRSPGRPSMLDKLINASIGE